jgi:hypothetical protein
MTQDAFTSLLAIKMAGLVECAAASEKMSFMEAMRKVYGSKLYHLLEQEETKLWHHSPRALYDAQASESRTGFPELPDE